MRRKPQTYALTAVAHQRRRLFQRAETAELFIATLFRYRDAGKFQLHAFVVMPDHVHVLLTPAPDMTIERSAQLIKGGFSFSARQIFPGEIWQEGYHADRITDDEDLRRQTFYILNNPARKRLDSYPWVSSSSAYAHLMDEAFRSNPKGLKPHVQVCRTKPGLKSGPIQCLEIAAPCQVFSRNPLFPHHFHAKTPALIPIE